MPDRHGPLRIGRFKVEIDDIEVPGWRSVAIPGSHTEEKNYDDGAVVWGETKFDDLEMERGVQPGDTKIFDWREEVRRGNADEGRKEIAVTLMDDEGEPQITWEFQGAWIKEYNPPELDATVDSEDESAIATESITVDFDTINRPTA